MRFAAVLGICSKRTYEGECAMKLESSAYYGESTIEIPYEIENNVSNGMEFLNTSKILLKALELKENGENINNIAFGAQKAVALGLADLAVNAAEKTGVEIIGATGGVFYNEAISVLFETQLNLQVINLSNTKIHVQVTVRYQLVRQPYHHGVVGEFP